MNEMVKTGPPVGILHGAEALDSRSHPRVSNLQKTAILNSCRTQSHSRSRAHGRGLGSLTPPVRIV